MVRAPPGELVALAWCRSLGKKGNEKESNTVMKNQLIVVKGFKCFDDVKSVLLQRS